MAEPLLLRNRVVPDLRKLEVYRAQGGYRAASTALTQQTPEQLIDLVKASNLRGRGGAGFPTGMKWGFLPKQTEKPVYLCVNADESEPGTFKDREIMEDNPHLLIEGVLITAFAIRCHTAYIYMRGEFANVHRTSRERRRRGARGRHHREEHPRHRLRPRRLGAPRCRRLHLRRRDRADRIARGQARLSARQAAVPGDARPLRVSDHREQRRDARVRAADRRTRRGVVQGHRTGVEPRPEALLRLAATSSGRASSSCRWAPRSARSSTSTPAASRTAAP